MLPLQLITGFFTNLLALALIGADIYLFREWYNYKDTPSEEEHARWLLAAVIVLGLLTFAGKWLMTLLLGKPGKDEPDMQRSNENMLLKRPEGHSLFVEFYGQPDAQPLILIHGWSSNSTQWYYLKKHLSSQFRVILFDLPGLGNSTKRRPKDYTLENFANDLDAVIDLAGTDKKPIVMGHSIGGMTLLTYCKLFTQKANTHLAGIGLIQTTYTNPVHTSVMSGLLTALEKPVLLPLTWLMIALAPYFQLMNFIKYINGSQHLNNHLTGFAGTETRGQLNLATWLTTVSPVGVIARGVLAMFKYEARDVLPNIQIPVLVVAGNKDILTKPEASRMMAAELPNARLVMLQPSGHMGATERNEQLTEAVRQFGTSLQYTDKAVTAAY